MHYWENEDEPDKETLLKIELAQNKAWRKEAEAGRKEAEAKVEKLTKAKAEEQATEELAKSQAAEPDTIAQVARAVQASTYCSPRAARVAVEMALKHGTFIKLATRHGVLANLARQHSTAKAGASDFMGKVQALRKASGLSWQDALRLARGEYPEEFAAYQAR